MADLCKNRKYARRNKSHHEPEAKHRKQIGTGKTKSVNATDVEAITSICNELLERIFNLLDLQSLLNVAGTCKRLQIAAAAEFGRKFSRKHIYLFSKGQYVKGRRFLKNGIRLDKICGILVSGYTILPFLRCFGAKMLQLKIVTPNNREIQYINRLCADTLTMICLSNVEKEIFAGENITKPFKMVETVELGTYTVDEFSNLGEEFSQFAYWFPILQNLTLQTDCLDYDFSAICLPSLHTLKLFGKFDSYFKKKHVERFLQANEQLRCLDIKFWDLPFSKLLDLISKDTMLKKLKAFNYNSGKQMKTAQLLRFANQHPMMVEHDLFSYYLKTEDIIAVVRLLNSLKYFRFLVKDQTECDHLLDRLKYELSFEANVDGMYPTCREINLKIKR